jgi:hypothetical protein
VQQSYTFGLQRIDENNFSKFARPQEPSRDRRPSSRAALGRVTKAAKRAGVRPLPFFVLTTCSQRGGSHPPDAGANRNKVGQYTSSRADAVTCLGWLINESIQNG